MLTTGITEVEDVLGITIRVIPTRACYAENGYAILKCNVDSWSIAHARVEGKKLPSAVTIKGSMTDPKIGQTYEVHGDMMWNSRWRSYELAFDSYRTVLPDDNDGIVRYLVQVAKWVGTSTAKKLVEKFGEKTLTVLKDAPELATDIDGITEQRAHEISESLRAEEAGEAAAVEIATMIGGILPQAIARKAIKKWGCDAAAQIRKNAFVLTELRGVAFRSADAVYQRLEGDPDSDVRLYAAAREVLSEAAARGGHTVMDSFAFESAVQSLMSRTTPALPEAWERASETAVIERGSFSVALPDLASAERYVASKLGLIITTCKDLNDAPLEISAEGLAEDQIAAIATVASSPVSLLVGAPGTGKTYTVARIVESLRRMGKTVQLAAPTGKAAKQMGVALGCDGAASTIHSMLEPEIDEDGDFHFGRDEDEPLDCDVLVIDETSMVDVNLMRSLLRAVRSSTRLLCVGDHYQLPSVGPGAVLRDMIETIPHAELTQIKRNAGRIVRACHAVKDGRLPEPADKINLETGDNWRHFEAGSDEDITAIIAMLVKTILPGRGFCPKWDVQVISPLNTRGKLSCEALNSVLREIVNPTPCDEKLKMGVGDKVVRLKNAKVKGIPTSAVNMEAPEVRVVNGDLGEIIEIGEKTVNVKFLYPVRPVRLKRSELELRLAYAMTCHKLQGSECPVAIIPLSKGLSGTPVVNREWIYTAMSRAKQMLITVGDLDAMETAIRKVGNTARKTQLGRYLSQ